MEVYAGKVLEELCFPPYSEILRGACPELSEGFRVRMTHVKRPLKKRCIPTCRDAEKILISKHEILNKLKIQNSKGKRFDTFGF